MMKRFLYSVVLVLYGLVVASSSAYSQTVIIPLTYEATGIVLELAADLSRINIDGQEMAIDSDASIHNMVNSDPVAPLKVGSEVGYESNQMPGGGYLVTELWVLSSPP